MEAAPVTELEARVNARKLELISEIIEHRKNSSRAGAQEAIDKLKARLSELAIIVKAGVPDGWANVGAQARVRLDEWMTK
jgi:hypothetical protein